MDDARITAAQHDEATALVERVEAALRGYGNPGKKATRHAADARRFLDRGWDNEARAAAHKAAMAVTGIRHAAHAMKAL